MRYYDIILPENMFEHGRYVAFKLRSKSAKQLQEFCRKQNIPNVLEQIEFHITLVYSKKDFEWTPLGFLTDYIKIDPKTFYWDIFGEEKNTLVLRCDNEFLHKRHKQALDKGAQSDFDEYNQHISVSYNIPKDFDISKLDVPDFPIYLNAELQEPLKEQKS